MLCCRGAAQGLDWFVAVVLGGAVLDLGVLYLVYRGIGLMRTTYLILGVLSLLVNLFSLPEFMMELNLPAWLVLFLSGKQRHLYWSIGHALRRLGHLLPRASGRWGENHDGKRVQ